MSGEHIVSRGVFSQATIDVGGLPYLKGGRRSMHIDDLVTKVLCAGHNSDLSPLDQALIDLTNVLREADRLTDVRLRMRGQRLRSVRLVVDGPRIERCILKMVMNAAFVLRDSLGGWTPPRWLPDVIFGRRELQSGAGLGAIASPGDRLGGFDGAHFFFGSSVGEKFPNAIVLELQSGLRFMCSWDRPLCDLGILGIDGKLYDTTKHVLHHVNGINTAGNSGDLGVYVDFDWSGRWSESKHRAVKRLRPTYKAPPRKGR